MSALAGGGAGEGGGSGFGYSGRSLEQLRELSGSVDNARIGEMQTHFTSLADQVDDVVSQLVALRKDLPNWWKGKAADTAMASFDRVISHAQSTHDVAAGAAQALKICSAVVGEQQSAMAAVPEVDEPARIPLTTQPFQSGTAASVVMEQSQAAQYETARAQAVGVVDGLAAQFVETRAQLGTLTTTYDDSFSAISRNISDTRTIGASPPEEKSSSEVFDPVGAGQQSPPVVTWYEKFISPSSHFASNIEVSRRPHASLVKSDATDGRFEAALNFPEYIASTRNLNAAPQEANAEPDSDPRRESRRNLFTTETEGVALGSPEPKTNPIKRVSLHPTDSNISDSPPFPAPKREIESYRERQGRGPYSDDRRLSDAGANFLSPEQRASTSPSDLEMSTPDAPQGYDSIPGAANFNSGATRSQRSNRGKRPDYLRAAKDAWPSTEGAAPSDGVLTPDWADY